MEKGKTSIYLVDLIQVCLLKENFTDARKFLELLRQNDPTKAGKTEPGFEVCKLAYAEVVNSPEAVAATIEDFLGQKLDLEAMKNQVDAKLYRNKVIKF